MERKLAMEALAAVFAQILFASHAVNIAMGYELMTCTTRSWLERHESKFQFENSFFFLN